MIDRTLRKKHLLSLLEKTLFPGARYWKKSNGLLLFFNKDTQTLLAFAPLLMSLNDIRNCKAALQSAQRLVVFLPSHRFRKFHLQQKIESQNFARCYFYNRDKDRVDLYDQRMRLFQGCKFKPTHKLTIDAKTVYQVPDCFGLHGDYMYRMKHQKTFASSVQKTITHRSGSLLSVLVSKTYNFLLDSLESHAK